MDLLILLLLVVAFDCAAWKWGVDSGDGLYSPEWEKRSLRGHIL